VKPVQAVLIGFVFVWIAGPARAESRTVLIQIKQDGEKRSVVTIHSDDAKERRSTIAVDEAVKVVTDMRGWGSSVGIYISFDHNVPRESRRALLAAINTNIWLDLQYFGPGIPQEVGDHFLRNRAEKRDK
jgi:hypothetical protein